MPVLNWRSHEPKVNFSASLTIVEPKTLGGFTPADLARVVSGVTRAVSDYEALLDVEAPDDL